jgi:hypothetical protein
VHPGVALEPHRMAHTLATLGPRPIVELHAVGLKVGQLLFDAGYPASGGPTDYAGLVGPVL